MTHVNARNILLFLGILPEKRKFFEFYRKEASSYVILKAAYQKNESPGGSALRAISRAIDRFCEKHRRFGIPWLMRYIVFISAVVFLIYMMDTTYTLLDWMGFDPEKILAGQVWRLVTWVFLPLNDGLIFTALMLYFYFFIGGTLEREWGTPKFTIYYISGILFNVIYGFAMWFLNVNSDVLAPNYINLSMFFAFAALFPDHRVLLFFFIPIKIKWLALADAIFFAYSIVLGLVQGLYFAAFLPIIALLNFLLICGSDVLAYLRPYKARSSPQSINFRKATREVRREYETKNYRHKCSVCGKTDADFPELEFRYCSRCEGYHCFCADHINNHVHFQ